MGIGQVADMDVVADATAVRSVVVRAENFNMRTPTADGFQHNGQQVVGVLLQTPDFAINIVARRVEITQAGEAQTPEFAVPCQDTLDL